ncbi:MAG: hypothetical protein M1830_008849 [Pleopsidium flavum]|nr:MAG: hypothetical protein M1830_008849 [Pleopsidium flavum]
MQFGIDALSPEEADPHGLVGEQLLWLRTCYGPGTDAPHSELLSYMQEPMCLLTVEQPTKMSVYSTMQQSTIVAPSGLECSDVAPDLIDGLALLGSFEQYVIQAKEEKYYGLRYNNNWTVDLGISGTITTMAPATMSFGNMRIYVAAKMLETI